MTPGWHRTVGVEDEGSRWHWWNGHRFGCGIARAPDAAHSSRDEPKRACLSCHRVWRAWKRVQEWEAAHGK